MVTKIERYKSIEHVKWFIDALVDHCYSDFGGDKQDVSEFLGEDTRRQWLLDIYSCYVDFDERVGESQIVVADMPRTPDPDRLDGYVPEFLVVMSFRISRVLPKGDQAQVLEDNQTINPIPKGCDPIEEALLVDYAVISNNNSAAVPWETLCFQLERDTFDEDRYPHDETFSAEVINITDRIISNAINNQKPHGDDL